jgi:hypothetical protein
MSWSVLQVVVPCGFGVCSALLYAGFLVVTARRPADNRDEFIRKLPPPSQPLAVRAAHLRLLARQELIRCLKFDALIAGAVVVLGVAVTASDLTHIWAGLAATAILTVVLVVGYAVMSGLFVLARFRGAQRRLRNDDVWHASSDGPPAAGRTDIEHPSTP